MGGTFDPIHIGHLIAAETARDTCGLDEIWFIPSYLPPLKDNEPGVESLIRYEMVQEAVKTNPLYQALDIELVRGGTSYSYDTARQLTEQYPEHDFYYIIGSDRINDLPKWHRIEELSALVGFIGLERPDTPIRLEGLPGYLNHRLRLANMPPIGISSTDIRERLKAGQSIRYLVPDNVHELIRRNGWYES
ncbi:nicotinate-nucleotide adenylyltransferase [Paenibacillus protaetiae]|uniref:Probable nicotinate-nucleotide adenylyltransferase n=1 Tax=Paenibacillus protaetiae TaxID=2509456 RepID=A0A4V0YFN2_9BACL|nr:nicotinate-nucleotide adenylyltransferase [Paenibacillus protaetiae]QAY68301.1 nicotinate (nicotinamide) nucleotide adenylyltransferase [Paenibacillus protaetiae]